MNNPYVEEDDDLYEFIEDDFDDQEEDDYADDYYDDWDDYDDEYRNDRNQRMAEASEGY